MNEKDKIFRVISDDRGIQGGGRLEILKDNISFDEAFEIYKQNNGHLGWVEIEVKSILKDGWNKLNTLNPNFNDNIQDFNFEQNSNYNFVKKFCISNVKKPEIKSFQEFEIISLDDYIVEFINFSCEYIAYMNIKYEYEKFVFEAKSNSEFLIVIKQLSTEKYLNGIDSFRVFGNKSEKIFSYYQD